MNQIILADDQTIFRAGVASVLSLEHDMQIVAQCDEYAMLLIMLESFREATVIVSFNILTDLDAMLVRIESSGSRVIVISGNGDKLPPDLASYVDGIIPREISGGDLVSCVRRIPQWRRCVLKGKISSLKVPDNAGIHACKRLTPKEMQIVALIGRGCTNKHIAAQLNTKEQGIKNYLRIIYDKIGVSNRLELAIFTFRHLTLARAAAAGV